VGRVEAWPAGGGARPLELEAATTGHEEAADSGIRRGRRPRGNDAGGGRQQQEEEGRIEVGRRRRWRSPPAAGAGSE